MEFTKDTMIKDIMAAYPDIKQKLLDFRTAMVSEAESEGGRGFEF